MGLTGGLTRVFYYGLNRVEVTGLDKFLQTLDKRKDVEGRTRGLITGRPCCLTGSVLVLIADDSIKPRQHVWDVT